MQCSRCGQMNANAAQFCIRCGQALTSPFAATVGNAPASMSEPPAPFSSSLPASAYTPAAPPSVSFPGVSPLGATPSPSAIPFQAPLPLPSSSAPTSASSMDSSSTDSSGMGMPQSGSVPGPQTPYPISSVPAVPSASNTHQRRPGATDWSAVQRRTTLTFACRLCGGPVPGNRTACPVCGAPHGMIANPNDDTGATYIAAGTQAPPPADAIEVLASRTLPPPIGAMRWNWGAFGASTPWLLAHPRLVGWGLITLLLMLLMPLVYFGSFYLLIPALGVLISLFAGLQGNTLAWQFGKHPDIETFKRSERRWAFLGILGAFGKIVLLTLLAVLALVRK